MQKNTCAPITTIFYRFENIYFFMQYLVSIALQNMNTMTANVLYIVTPLFNLNLKYHALFKMYININTQTFISSNFERDVFLNSAILLFMDVQLLINNS